MTYIEFFDKNASENVSACLTYAPNRVIYIGDNSTLMKKHIANYQRVFADREQHIEFLFKTVSKNNLDNAVALLSELVDTYEDCVFDATGGDEILTLALGIVHARYPHRNIQIHRLNLRNNTIYDWDKDGTTIYRDAPELSVEENVRIYGGDVVYGGVEEDNTYQWDLSDEFLKDVERIWSICKGNVRLWNVQIGIFETVEKIGTLSEDHLTTTVSRAALEDYLLRQNRRYKKAKGMITAMLKQGLLTWFWDEDDTVTISYKNLQVKKCLTNAGRALEMKMYTMARAVTDKSGVPAYNDTLCGVVIDWDGELHDEEQEDIYDTENEIDVLLMHGVVPVFVSCKNGVVTADELYKLNTVAERFGGQYAKKVLVANALGSMGETGHYLRQRAVDMNIRLLENIQDLDDSELARKIRSFWSN